MEKKNEMACTILLTAINVAVFFLLSFGGMTEDGLYMLKHGAMYAPYILQQKEYYRIFTGMFLHFGFSHLINNMLSLLVFGRYIEPIVGRARFLLIYIFSGLGGNLLSLAGEMLSRDYVISAGASGAVFGLSGSLLCLALLNRGKVAGITKQSVLFMIVISLYNGFTSEGINNLAHIGGLLTGFVITFLLCFQQYLKSRPTTL